MMNKAMKELYRILRKKVGKGIFQVPSKYVNSKKHMKIFQLLTQKKEIKPLGNMIMSECMEWIFLKGLKMLVSKLRNVNILQN